MSNIDGLLQALQDAAPAEAQSSQPTQQPPDPCFPDFQLGPAHLGHLRCLLHMGHVQGMLAEVDGWAGHCAGENHTPVYDVLAVYDVQLFTML